MLRNTLMILLLTTSILFSQFKDKRNIPEITGGVTNNSPSSFLTDFFSPQNFYMHHSLSVSYSAFAGNGVALTTYINSMGFKLSENLQLEIDASLVASPYSSFGAEHQKSINGIYLNRAALNYKISKNSKLSIQYFHMPVGMYYGHYPYYNSPFANDCRFP